MRMPTSFSPSVCLLFASCFFSITKATKNILPEHCLRRLLFIIFTGTLTATTLALLTSSGHITPCAIVRESVQSQKCATAPPPFSCPKQLELTGSHHTALYPHIFQPTLKLETGSTSTATWVSLLLKPNSGFLLVAEASGAAKGYYSTSCIA